jgi:hypothetical protein
MFVNVIIFPKFDLCSLVRVKRQKRRFVVVPNFINVPNNIIHTWIFHYEPRSLCKSGSSLKAESFLLQNPLIYFHMKLFSLPTQFSLSFHMILAKNPTKPRFHFPCLDFWVVTQCVAWLLIICNLKLNCLDDFLCVYLGYL